MPLVEPAKKMKAAIIGSGNIGTDLMIKIVRHSKALELTAFIGIDPGSDGLARAKRVGVSTTHEGGSGFIRMPEFSEVDIVFDATSAGAHREHAALCRAAAKHLTLGCGALRFSR